MTSYPSAEVNIANARFVNLGPLVNYNLSFLSRFDVARYRRRRSSAYDGRLRKITRGIEQRLKFALTNPLGWIVRPKRLSSPLDPKTVNGILILRYDALGDVVLATPVWRSIKKYAPHIRVGVVGSERNAALLRSDPDIDEVFIFSKRPTFRVFREMLRARRFQWDLVLNLYFHDKTRAATYARMVAPGAVSTTIVRERHEKYRALYGVVGDRPPIDTPMVLQNLRVLEGVLNLPITDQDRVPTLKVPEQWRLTADQLLRSRLKPSETFVILNTDASQTYREWGLQNSHELSKLIVEQHADMRVFWTSAPDRRERVETFLASTPLDRVDYLPTNNLLLLVALIAKASVVISPDTSVIHFAAAQGIPVVGFYLEPTEFLPFGTDATVLYTPDRLTTSLISVTQAFEAFETMFATRSRKATE